MFELRYYQKEAVDSIFNYFSQKRGNPVVAMPTGTGKSLVIADLIKRVLQTWPNQRFLALTHVKELIDQNSAKLIEHWPTAPVGVYSAGLNRRDTMQPAIFGGIASVVNSIKQFGHRDLVLVDECHLISPNDNSMYQKAIGSLKEINPALKVVGLSATPFRLGQGMITDGGLFTDVCYDLCSIESFNRLIGEGYLSPLIPKRTNMELDLSGVGMSRGDYAKGQLQKAVDKEQITYEAVREMIEQGADRESWLTFCSGVEHCEHVAEMLQSFGIQAAAVHSKLEGSQRDDRIAAFKAGELRCLTNNNVLTTGFDHPKIDMIGVLNATMSPAKWVQMLGRGTRPFEGKENCLVLDFAGNTKRLGPINDPVIPKKRGKGNGDVPIKICETCGCYNHTTARVCVSCGEEFTFKTKLKTRAGTEELIKDSTPEVKTFEVSHVLYNAHKKKGSIQAPSVKVSYMCGLRMFNEWVCPEHVGFAGKKARDWWRTRHDSEPPETVADFLERTSDLRIPRKIRVWVNKQYPEIMNYEY